MSNRGPAEFPNVEAKLQQPTKKSAFERQKAEAEAKRQREAAEAAAVYEDFVKSFGRGDDNDSRRDARPAPGRSERPGGTGGPTHLSGGGRRHFGIPSANSGPRSGPGSLGPAPSSYNKKRPYDGFSDRKDREEGGRGRLAFDDHEPMSISKAFNASDDEEEPVVTGRAEEKAISKPTLRLANLPPGTSPAYIKSLIPPNLTVDNVKVLPPSGPGGTDRKSATAIVTLSTETAATDMDAAVSALQSRYLGFGFYLSLHRHLSSAAMSGALASTTTTSTGSQQPFGAKTVSHSGNDRSVHSQRGRGFAPPPSFAPPGNAAISRDSIFHVPVQPPKDIKKLRAIHKVIEAIMEHGPEFEALLMSRPDVQREEKWAWIWDARSEAGVWYRYRLWEAISGLRTRRGQGKFVPLFEGSHAWKTPDQPLPFEYNTGVDEFVSDSDYNSSDDEDFDDLTNKPGDAGANDQEDMFLNPMEKSKLAHLLARLPTSLSKLRKGDIARITAFAFTHVNRGADEIVDMIVSNIERPFAYTYANPEHRPASRDKSGRYTGDSGASSPTRDEKAPAGDSQDTSAARLIGLYVVSDILSSSATGGIRHAWRYRQLFEGALRNRKVFESLGLMADRLNWGRLRAEKWKRSVGLILSHLEGSCVFTAAAHEHFVNSFENPPQAQKEEKVDEDAAKKGKWKAVDAAAAKPVEDAGFRPIAPSEADVSGEVEEAKEAEEAADDASAAELDVDELDVDELDVDPGAESDHNSLYSIVYYDPDPELEAIALQNEDIDGRSIHSSDESSYEGIEGSVGDEDADVRNKDVDVGKEDVDMENELVDVGHEGAGVGNEHADVGNEDAAPDEAPPKEVKSVGPFQMSSTTLAPSKKRMRAVDMFAGSDSEG